MPMNNPYNYLGGISFQPIAMPNAPTANWQGSVANGIDSLTNALQSYYDRQQKLAMMALDQQKTAGEIAANTAAAERNKYLMNKTKTDDATIAGIPTQRTENVDESMSPFIANPALSPTPAPEMLGDKPVLGPQAPLPDVNVKYSYQAPSTLSDRQAYISDPKNVGAFASPEGTQAAKLALDPDLDPHAREGAGKFSEWAKNNPKASLDEYNQKAQEIEHTNPGFTGTSVYVGIMNNHKAAIDDLRQQQQQRDSEAKTAAMQKEAEARRVDSETNKQIANANKHTTELNKERDKANREYMMSTGEMSGNGLFKAANDLAKAKDILDHPKDLSSTHLTIIVDALARANSGKSANNAQVKKFSEIGSTPDQIASWIAKNTTGQGILTDHARGILNNVLDVSARSINDDIERMRTKQDAQAHQTAVNMNPGVTERSPGDQIAQDSSGVHANITALPTDNWNQNSAKRKVWDPATGTFISQ